MLHWQYSRAHKIVAFWLRILFVVILCHALLFIGIKIKERFRTRHAQFTLTQEENIVLIPILFKPETPSYVIPAKAGIQSYEPHQQSTTQDATNSIQAAQPPASDIMQLTSVTAPKKITPKAPIKKQPVAQHKKTPYRAHKKQHATANKPTEQVQTQKKIMPYATEHIALEDLGGMPMAEYVLFKKKILQQWQPPIGIDRQSTCTLKLQISTTGTIESIDVCKPSGTLLYDIAARDTLVRIPPPKSLFGRSLLITFKT